MAVTSVLCVCTGNVARSVMLAHMLETLAGAEGLALSVATAGTHAVEGSAISTRTRLALEGLDELGPVDYGAHRSRQVTESDLRGADLVLCAEASQVRLLRQWFPASASRVVALGDFVRFAPLEGGLEAQVQEVAAREPDGALDVLDPAGGEQEDYDRCAQHLWALAQATVVLLGA